MSSDLKQVCYRERLRYGALAKKILLKLSVVLRVEVSSVESNETTAATVSCDLAPPPQRRRRRHPPPPPPRNLFVTFQGSKKTYLSLHNRLRRLRDQTNISALVSSAAIKLGEAVLGYHLHR